MFSHIRTHQNNNGFIWRLLGILYSVLGTSAYSSHSLEGQLFCPFLLSNDVLLKFNCFVRFLSLPFLLTNSSNFKLNLEEGSCNNWDYSRDLLLQMRSHW